MYRLKNCASSIGIKFGFIKYLKHKSMLQKPKGTLIPIAGNDIENNNYEIFKRVIKETGKKIPQICLFTLAADIPEKTEIEFKNTFKKLGIENISIINYNVHAEADSLENLEKLKNADAVIFSNGNQVKLTSLLGGTHLINRIKKRYYNEPDFVIAGFSAGATAMSNTMIVSCSSNDAMLKGELELTNGLNLISSIFIDTRFSDRGRFGCLIQTVTFNPAVLGVSLGENTALVIKNEEIEVIGSGLIAVVDGTSVAYTDLTEISHGEPITVEGIKMHFLNAGKRFLIHQKQIQKTTVAA
jgi:cyanophycinase